jgi:thioester reductase-like protein
MLRKPNVLGTREVLRLATREKKKWLHFTSSVAIFRAHASADEVTSVHERSDIEHLGSSLKQGYALSKWASEMLLEAGRKAGALVNIFRLGYISGSSTTGASSTDDARVLLLKACRAIGAAPMLDRLADMAPVDFVSRALIALARRQAPPGRNLHLFNHLSPTWSQLVDSLSAPERRITAVSYEDWKTGLRARGQGSQDAWLRLFLEECTHDWLTRRVEVACELTNASLAEVDLRWPHVDAALVRKYLEYYADADAI